MNPYTQRLAKSLSEGDQDAAAELGRILLREGHLPNTYVLVHLEKLNRKHLIYPITLKVEDWMPGVEDFCDRLEKDIARRHRDALQEREQRYLSHNPSLAPPDLLPNSTTLKIKAIFKGSLASGETDTLNSFLSFKHFCTESFEPNLEEIHSWGIYFRHLVEDFTPEFGDQDQEEKRAYQVLKKFLEEEELELLY